MDHQGSATAAILGACAVTPSPRHKLAGCSASVAMAAAIDDTIAEPVREPVAATVLRNYVNITGSEQGTKRLLLTFLRRTGEVLS